MKCKYSYAYAYGLKTKATKATLLYLMILWNLMLYAIIIYYYVLYFIILINIHHEFKNIILIKKHFIDIN